jgi:hypothetical protein
MLKWLEIIVRTVVSTLCTQRSLAIENLVLRQQLAVLKHRHPRPRLTDTDRFFWVVLSRIWADWRESLHIVQPETVVRWHRQGFRYYWRWKSRRRGQPRIDPENGARTHLSLAKDTPDGRQIQAIENGSVVELKRVGGLHHLYTRVAA